jgi:uncharacterized protein (TIGR04255 family)
MEALQRIGKMATEKLPEFADPPVSEVALSIQFNPLSGWQSPHGGLYWARIKNAYPSTEVQPPLPSQIELFDESQRWKPSFQIQLANPEDVRLWFLSNSKSELIQVQNNRFVINWRKASELDQYPRYLSQLRPRFEREWSDFCEFAKEQQLGPINVLQCEVTYVNDFIKGKDWQAFPDFADLFSPIWKKNSSGFLSNLESMMVNGAVRLPDGSGRLHFSMQHAQRQSDKKEIIQFRLIARGKPMIDSLDGILSWMDSGHNVVVRAFADLTSSEAHKSWGRTQ